MSVPDEKISLLAFWGPRKESLDVCAERALDCLRKLAACDESFARQWYQCGRSLKETLASKVDLTVESLRRYLEKGRNRRDDNKAVIERLGCRLGPLLNRASSGYDYDDVDVTLKCGAYVDLETLPVPNTCDIEFPHSGPAAERLLHPDKFRCCMSALVTSYDPDWAEVTNSGMIQAVYPGSYPHGHRGYRVGWVTYVSDRHGRLPELPAGYEVTRIDGLGNLIVIKGIDRLTASNPAHVDAVRQLSEILKRAGMLTYLRDK